MPRADCPACGKPIAVRALLFAVTPLRLRCTHCGATLKAGRFVFLQGGVFALCALAVAWWAVTSPLPLAERRWIATLSIVAIAAVNVGIALRFGRYRAVDAR